MSAQLALTAVLTISPGKEDRFFELFNACAEYTQKNEPFVLTYELSRGSADQGGKLTEVVVREAYENQAGFEKHMAGKPVQDLMAAMAKEKLVTGSKIVWQQPPKIGFASRL